MERVPLYIHGLSSLAIMPMTCPSLDVVFSPMELFPQEGLQCHSTECTFRIYR